MPAHSIRLTLLALVLIFVTVGGYHRVQSQRPGERLDRTKEGWPLLIGIRLLGLLSIVSTAVCLSTPSLFAWASLPISTPWRWVGVLGFACSIAWLLWMFRTLGPNLTDTVVTRKDAYFVNHGPYRFVRNPMYTGVLIIGLTIGLALATWLIPAACVAMFILFALRTRTEEKYLIERFGSRYLDYMQQVGRFFPKPRQR